jgi:hypothetical protein
VFHRNDRQTGRGGGTGVYIKRCIDHYALITPAMRNEIEATCVVVRTASSGSLKIVSAYNPPGCHLCDADLDTLLSNTGPTILCGDLNAKHAAWNSRRANAMGTELHGFSLRRNDVCILGPTEPTLYHHRGSLPDVIDIVVTRKLPMTVDLTVLRELSSDHNPVLIQIGGPTHRTTITKKITSWPIFADAIQEELPEVPRINDVRQLEASVDELTSAISRAISRASSEKELKTKNPIQLPLAVRELIREKNRARRRYQHSLDPKDKRAMTALQDEVKSAIREHRNDSWERMLQELDPQDRNFWRFINRFKNRKESALPRPLHGRHGMVFTDEDKAEVLADSLESQCQTVQQNTNDDLIHQVNREVRRTLAENPQTRLRHTTPNEVQKILKELKMRKASGPDGIPNEASSCFP